MDTMATPVSNGEPLREARGKILLARVAAALSKIDRTVSGFFTHRAVDGVSNLLKAAVFLGSSTLAWNLLGYGSREHFSDAFR
jgi:hypothetical protein